MFLLRIGTRNFLTLRKSVWDRRIGIKIRAKIPQNSASRNGFVCAPDALQTPYKTSREHDYPVWWSKIEPNHLISLVDAAESPIRSEFSFKLTKFCIPENAGVYRPPHTLCYVESLLCQYPVRIRGKSFVQFVLTAARDQILGYKHQNSAHRIWEF